MDKAIIITGASRGIGREAATALLRKGYNAAICARNAGPLQELAEDFPGQVFFKAFDIADFSSVKTFVEEAAAKFGGIAGVISNAGLLGPCAPLGGDAREDEANAWEEALLANSLGPYNLIKATLPYLRQTQGHFVQITSGAAFQPLTHFSAYCASKAAVTMLTGVLAAEEPGITAINFMPAETDTDMQKIIGEHINDLPEPLRSHFVDSHAKGLMDCALAGKIIAWLVLYAPHSLSGKTLNALDPTLQREAQKCFM